MSEAIIGFIGVIVGALLAPLVEWIRSWRADKKEAIYIAIRVICIFDKFIDMCVDVAADNGEPDEEGWYYYHAATPDLEPFPEDLDWRVINHKLAYDILSFPKKIHDTQRYIQRTADFLGGPYDDLGPELQYEYSILGLFALDVVSSLRKAYDIPQDRINPREQDWSHCNFLTETKEKIEKSRKEYEKRHAEFIASMGEKTKLQTQADQ